MSYLNIFIKYFQKYLLKIAFLFDQSIAKNNLIWKTQFSH